LGLAVSQQLRELVAVLFDSWCIALIDKRQFCIQINDRSYMPQFLEPIENCSNDAKLIGVRDDGLDCCSALRRISRIGHHDPVSVTVGW
jgi:hypothetical protein